MQKVILGMQYEPYHSLFAKHFHDFFEVCDTRINSVKELQQPIMEFEPDIIVFAEKFLDFNGIEDISQEAINFLKSLPEKIRVCYICTREIDDPFFDDLKELGVRDIFYSEEIDIIRIVQQLKRRANSENVVFYGTPTIK
ncbi:hypothetical protein ACI7MO_09985 [Bacillus paranthracis]|uniref:hypothetical protein n=1 Tax=Bacillus paranthracis TaxID=2026186 RepID=UPI00397B23D7